MIQLWEKIILKHSDFFRFIHKKFIINEIPNGFDNFILDQNEFKQFNFFFNKLFMIFIRLIR